MVYSRIFTEEMIYLGLTSRYYRRVGVRAGIHEIRLANELINVEAFSSRSQK